MADREDQTEPVRLRTPTLPCGQRVTVYRDADSRQTKPPGRNRPHVMAQGVLVLMEVGEPLIVLVPPEAEGDPWQRWVTGTAVKEIGPGSTVRTGRSVYRVRVG